VAKIMQLVPIMPKPAMPTAWLTSTLAPQQSGSIFAVDGMVQCVMAIHYGQKPMDPIHYERQVLAAKKK